LGVLSTGGVDIHRICRSGASFGKNAASVFYEIFALSSNFFNDGKN